MTDGENKSDTAPASDFFIDGNGQAVNEEVVIYMGKEAKENIEKEFDQLGVKSWQELMGQLINKRHILLQADPLPDKIFRDKKPVNNSKTNIPTNRFKWWHIVIVLTVSIALIVFLVKLSGKKSLPKIEFG